MAHPGPLNPPWVGVIVVTVRWWPHDAGCTPRHWFVGVANRGVRRGGGQGGLGPPPMASEKKVF